MMFVDSQTIGAVTLDPGWRLAWNLHPNARAAHAIAAAVAARLEKSQGQ